MDVHETDEMAAGQPTAKRSSSPDQTAAKPSAPSQPVNFVTPSAIPGLGFARSSETLPKNNFMPESINQVLKTQDAEHLPPPLAASVTTAKPAVVPSATAAEDIEMKDPVSADLPPNGNVGASLEKDATPIAQQDVQPAPDRSHVSEDAAEGDDNEVDITRALEATLEAAHASLIAGPSGAGGQAETNGGMGATTEAGSSAALAVEDVEGSEGDSDSDSDSDSSSDADSDDSSGDEAIQDINAFVSQTMAAADMEDETSNPSYRIKSTHEKDLDILPKPDVDISTSNIKELGTVRSLVPDDVGVSVVIRSEVLTEDSARDRGTVLCTEDRTIIGVLHETFARVFQPFYVLKFRTQDEADASGIAVGLRVFYAVDSAKHIFPDEIRRRFRGTDASNLHDEEIPSGDDSSDDDAEKKKQKRQKGGSDRDGGRGGRGRGRGSHPHRGGSERRGNDRRNLERGGRGRGGIDRRGQDSGREARPDAPLNYDDEDGPYRPLQRPQSYGMPTPPPPQQSPGQYSQYGSNQNGQPLYPQFPPAIPQFSAGQPFPPYGQFPIPAQPAGPVVTGQPGQSQPIWPFPGPFPPFPGANAWPGSNAARNFAYGYGTGSPQPQGNQQNPPAQGWQQPHNPNGSPYGGQPH